VLLTCFKKAEMRMCFGILGMTIQNSFPFRLSFGDISLLFELNCRLTRVICFSSSLGPLPGGKSDHQ